GAHCYMIFCSCLLSNGASSTSSLISSFIFVFFSSRRRHTRSKRDWSSDVCSSDLHHAASFFNRKIRFSVSVAYSLKISGCCIFSFSRFSFPIIVLRVGLKVIL